MSLIPVPLRARNLKDLAKELLDRYMEGEEFSDICQDYGLKSPTGLYHVLLKECEDDWKAAQGARALSRLEEAALKLEASRDMTSVSKNTAMVKRAQWELEKVCRRIYGSDAPPVNIVFAIGTVQQRIEDLESELGVISAATKPLKQPSMRLNQIEKRIAESSVSVVDSLAEPLPGEVGVLSLNARPPSRA